MLPQLSSYLPAPSSDTRTPSMATTGSLGFKKRRNSIEGTFSAVSPRLPPTSHRSESELLKRKQSSSSMSVHDDVEGPNATPFSRLSSLYAAEGQASPLITSEGFSHSFSSTSPSQDGDNSTSGYFASQPATTAPRRERTSRYLSEEDRREIITRIDAGEKQVTLAREFCVSRAAICNLYKNRWEVLTRGSRNPESKHPKKTCSRKASPRLTSQTTTAELNIAVPKPEPTPVYPDVSTISIRSEESPRDDEEGSTVFLYQSTGTMKTRPTVAATHPWSLPKSTHHRVVNSSTSIRCGTSRRRPTNHHATSDRISRGSWRTSWSPGHSLSTRPQHTRTRAGTWSPHCGTKVSVR